MKKKCSNNDTVYVYVDNRKKYRWRRISANGTEVHCSSQGYKSISDCMKNYKRSFIKPKVVIHKWKKKKAK